MLVGGSPRGDQIRLEYRFKVLILWLHHHHMILLPRQLVLPASIKGVINHHLTLATMKIKKPTMWCFIHSAVGHLNRRRPSVHRTRQSIEVFTAKTNLSCLPKSVPNLNAFSATLCLSDYLICRPMDSLSFIKTFFLHYFNRNRFPVLID